MSSSHPLFAAEVACAAPADGDDQKVAVKRFYLY